MTILKRIALGTVLGLGVGCSSSDRSAYPVEFQVLAQGQPAVGAVVVLHPVHGSDSKTPLPTGKVDENGWVKLSTFAQNDGAPPGDYTVTIDWRDEIIVTDGSETSKDLSSDKLEGQYSNPASPHAPRVTIEKRQNKLPAIRI